MTRLFARLLPARPRRRANRALPGLLPAVDPWAEGEAFDPLIDTVTFPAIGACP